MNIETGLQLRSGVLLAAASVIVFSLCGCASAPTGYGVDARAERDSSANSAANSAANAASMGAKNASADAAASTPPDGANQATYLTLIRRMQQEDQYFASLAHIDAYEARFGASPESQLLRADALRLTDQRAASAAIYTRLESTPLAAAGYRGLGLLAGAVGDFADAATLLEHAVKLNSTDATTLSDLGYAQMRRGNFSAARVPLMTAAQLAPGNPKVLGNLALYLMVDGQGARAEAVMSGAQMSPELRRAIARQAGMLAPGSAAALPRPVASIAQSASDEGSASSSGASSSGASNSVGNSGVASARTAGAGLRMDFALSAPDPASAMNSAVVPASR